MSKYLRTLEKVGAPLPVTPFQGRRTRFRMV